MNRSSRFTLGYKPQVPQRLGHLHTSAHRRAMGGGITAALVLKEFTADVPWAHLDIPGPAKTKDAQHYLSAGATGFGVRTLVELASRMAES